MTKLDQLLQVYADWAEEIMGEEIEVRWCTDFGCYPQDPDLWLIEIGMLAKESDVADLPSFLLKEFDCQFTFDEIQFYTVCFLHECGHLQTYIADDERKEGITWNEYRYLPNEYAADRWAVEYINNNLKWRDWQAKLEKAYAAVTEKDLENFVENA